MENQNGHITSKVVIGYILLVLLAVGTIGYIYHVVEQVAVEDDSDSLPRQKIYLVTHTLSLLYQSEALGQLVGMPQNDLRHFNRTLNKAHQNMDSLRTLVSDSLQLLKIDTIDILLEQKRWNTRRLLETWNESNTEKLYTQNIEKIIAVPDTVVQRRVEVKKQQVQVQQDTVVVPRKKRGFFKRLAEVFSPVRMDTSIVVNKTQHVTTDTLVNTYNPADTIVSVLKSIQDSVAGQKQQLAEVLRERAANLRYSNSIITSRINQLLRDIEEEEMNASMGRLWKKQQLLKETSHRIGYVAIVSVIIVILFLFIIARDISRSKYYRMQLERAKQYAEDLLHSREKLILTISHDIRAPLSSIIGYIELLLRRHPDERQRYFLENMKGSSDHILSLVNDLLDYQRLEAGEMEIHPVPFRVAALFKEIYTSFKPLADAKQLRFLLDLRFSPEGEQAFLGDSIRIRQIVGNLLSNAIKFTREGQVTLAVTLWEESAAAETACAWLTVKVSDSGPGIPEEQQERIFGEFTRLSGSEETEGFGLGLSITLKLIHLLGGELSLQSTPGTGSDFTVRLPLKVADNPPEPQEEADETPFRDRSVFCLLVDDDPLQLALTEELLKQSHVQVVCCTDPYTVPEQLRSVAFDVVITDIQMPGMDGYHLLRLIRESGVPGSATIPVIALSASVAKEHRHYLEAGFTGFLNKPFTAAQLISLLNELLTTDLEAKSDIDFHSLTAFAGEDAEASASILQSFKEETAKNIAGLQEALDGTDRQVAMRLSHKMIPLFSMLGANALVQHLRILEKNDAELTEAGWRHLMEEVIGQAKRIVGQIG